MKFNYIALDQNGQETKGTIDAATESEAISALREQQLYPTQITTAGGDGTREPAPSRRRASRPGSPAPDPRPAATRLWTLRGLWRALVSRFEPKIRRLARDRRRCFSLLGLMVGNGVPILQALTLASRGASFSENEELFRRLRDDVRDGGSFVDALDAPTASRPSRWRSSPPARSRAHCRKCSP